MRLHDEKTRQAHTMDYRRSCAHECAHRDDDRRLWTIQRLCCATAPAVTVSQPVQRDVTDYLEFTGTTQAVQHVEIRARVQGFLHSVHFEEATDVKKGDLLYVIDPRPFQAQVNKAQADLSRKLAELELAKANYQRIETLYRQKAAPQADFVQAKAARDTAQADVAAARAVLEEAKLNLDYTQVRAPINGRVGRNLVSCGQSGGSRRKYAFDHPGAIRPDLGVF